MSEEASYDRVRANPMVGVADLEQGFKNYFASGGSRLLTLLVQLIALNGVTWKTAAKASCGDQLRIAIPKFLFLYFIYVYIYKN